MALKQMVGDLVGGSRSLRHARSIPCLCRAADVDHVSACLRDPLCQETRCLRVSGLRCLRVWCLRHVLSAAPVSRCLVAVPWRLTPPRWCQEMWCLQVPVCDLTRAEAERESRKQECQVLELDHSPPPLPSRPDASGSRPEQPQIFDDDFDPLILSGRIRLRDAG
jgi:hypothetical protein